MKLLLHACCGPCSLEPTRLLQEAGHDIAIYYANSNIAPRAEYLHRLGELQRFAASIGVPVIEGPHDPAAWERAVAPLGRMLDVHAAERDPAPSSVSELLDDENRSLRCRACYRLRLQEAARVAAESGFDAVSTTLSVSPYQFTGIIREELERAATAAGTTALFKDFRPYYSEAVRRSREAGMYRQDYCGCRFSIAEGQATRAFLKRERDERRERARMERATSDAAAAKARARRAAERRAYADKQARKRAALKALRAARASERSSA